MKIDDVIKRVLPRFFPQHWLASLGIVFTDFPSRVLVGYVLRAEGNYSYILDADFAALRLSLEELHAAALANLSKLPSASIAIGKVPGGSEGWISAKNDNFAAARILLPQIQGEFRAELGDMFLFVLPHRDWCFCWSLAQTPRRQENHAREALQNFLQDDYNLTPDILAYHRGNFRLHLEQVLPDDH